MQLYLYSAQDLILDSNALCNMEAGDFYKLNIGFSEIIKIYPTKNSGFMILNYDMLSTKKHNQIIYHQLSSNILLCEIKPLINTENAHQYNIKFASIRIVKYIDEVYIYFNGEYYGCIKQKCEDIKFEKFDKYNQEYGTIFINGDKKYLILFTSDEVLFCGAYIDYEKLNNCIQIYYHIPNIFNVGNVVKYNFETKQIERKVVQDRGDPKKVFNKEFELISFLEAVKCGRYKYAYKKLSYELKSEINIEVLSQYFKSFDKYVRHEDIYIMLNNYKIAGSCKFDIKDNIINNIY